MNSDVAISSTRRPNHSTLLSCTALLACACLGCGGGLKGTYIPAGISFAGALISSVTFSSSDKVEVASMGTTHEGTYVLDGKKVKITVSGDTTIMILDDQGCLDAGQMIGKLCKK